MIVSTLCALVMIQQGATPTTTVPFRLADDAIIVDAQVNGRAVSLMFDTGFGAAVDVSDSVNLGKQTGTITLTDFNGQFQAPTVKITSLKLGTMSIDTKNLEEAVKSREDFSLSYGMHCDGIMGLQVIKDSVVGINYEHSRFEFYPASTDISKWVPDNKRTFLVKMLPTGHSSVDMYVNAPDGGKMVMSLDTGNAFYATTHRDVLERLGLWSNSKTPKFVSQSMIASGTTDSWALKLDNMKIFGVPVPSAVWDIIDLPSATAENDGTVGYGFLHNFNIIMDYGRRRIWFENYSGKAADEEKGDIGIFAMGLRGSDVKVFHVTVGSPAEKAGIKVGDRILSIDGNELGTNVPFQKMRQLFEGPAGS
ncbi:MAG TPA: PDZ domain-containing protein, partial [Fimbriimonadaceae bacterium]|nr:PDZ domain-containing protein [Fimbriimonadaceae bacterium]